MSGDKNIDEKTGEAFLARWARVKEAARTQEVTAQPADCQSTVIAGQNLQFALPAASGGRLVGDPHADRNPRLTTSTGAPVQPKVPEEACPERTSHDSTVPVSSALPSLDSLTPQSDFSPFMAKDVDPHLRNQAMKKLFTDPHYNIMDRLDTYIDDYSTHPPLSIEVIRQMSISKSMRLFEDEEEAGAVPAAEAQLPALAPADVSVPQSPAVDADSHEPTTESGISDAPKKSPA